MVYISAKYTSIFFHGDVFTYNIDLIGSVEMTDYTYENESIHINIHGLKNGSNPTTVSYMLMFTGVTGELLTNPIMGSFPISAEGNAGIMTSFNLTNKSFSFSDIHLKLSYYELGNQLAEKTTWTIEQISLGVDADNVLIRTTPEPTTLMLFSFGLLGILGYLRKKHVFRKI